MRLEHANLTVTDIDRSFEFYRAVFNFEERWRGQVPGQNQATIRAIHIGNESSYLALFEAESPGTAPINYARCGLNHIGYVVNDLEPYRQRLAEQKIKVHFEPTYAPGKRIYFYDPDGVEIELVTY